MMLPWIQEEHVAFKKNFTPEIVKIFLLGDLLGDPFKLQLLWKWSLKQKPQIAA